MRRHVHVLLSTFNGAEYLREQLDSLLSQDYPHFSVHVRDDGSTDQTADIIREYAKKAPIGFHVSFGQNLGFNESFRKLLELEASEDDFFAFCDQDDVWANDKISRAVEMLSKSKHPETALYFGRLCYVDRNLKKIALSDIPRYLDFNNAVVENVVPGCTIVMGGGVRNYLLRAPASAMSSHDWWAYLCASAFGVVIYDSSTRIRYRRHGTNTSPWQHSPTSVVVTRAQEFLNRWRSRKIGFKSLQQAVRFIRIYREELSDDQASIVGELIDLRPPSSTVVSRFRYARKPKVHRNKRFDDLVMRAMIVLGQQ